MRRAAAAVSGRAVALGGLLAGCALIAACGGGEAPGGAEPPAAALEAPPTGRAIDPPAAAGALAPNLTLTVDGPILSWLEPAAGGGHRLLAARLDGGGWSAPAVVAEGDGFFANWADLPAVAEGGDGSLVAHWLAKTGEATYAYSVFLARSRDGGASWTGLGQLNDDATDTEHGFVSWVPEGDGLRAFWLDGRAMAGGGPMALRTALVGEAVGASEVLDPRVCECCSTDAAVAAGGAVAAYRDRGADETRDVAVVRRQSDGWSAPRAAAADGWVIAGCPVNGPAVAADGRTAALAWFTAAGDAPRVQAALSEDGGATFGPAIPIDAEMPLGRVDVVLDGAGGAVVAWLAAADELASVRLRRLGAGGALGASLEIATTGASRASGFPRLVRSGGTLYLAWVDTGPEEGHRIRAREIPLERLPEAL